MEHTSRACEVLCAYSVSVQGFVWGSSCSSAEFGFGVGCACAYALAATAAAVPTAVVPLWLVRFSPALEHHVEALTSCGYEGTAVLREAAEGDLDGASEECKNNAA
jgi:hypothetical protein